MADVRLSSGLQLHWLVKECRCLQQCKILILGYILVQVYNIHDYLKLYLPCTTATAACLQGFVSDIPEENTLMSYTRLRNNEDSTKTFLFPSTAFLCNGTLQELAIPYVVNGSDHLVWHTNLTANMSVWRPTATGYTEVVRFQLVVHLPGANEDLVVVRNTHSDTIVARPLKLVTVHKGDIIGFTLTPETNAEYIPILLMRTTAERSEQEECGDINTTRNCNIIRDKMPLVAVNVTIPQGTVRIRTIICKQVCCTYVIWYI